MKSNNMCQAIWLIFRRDPEAARAKEILDREVSIDKPACLIFSESESTKITTNTKTTMLSGEQS